MADDYYNPKDSGHLNINRQAKAVVIDVNDPKCAGRVRCMIIGLQEKISKDKLPWIHVQGQNNSNRLGVGFFPHNYYPGATVNLQGVGQQDWEVTSSVMNAQTDITTQDINESVKGEKQIKPVVRTEQNYEQHNRLRAFACSSATIAGIIANKNSDSAIDWETTEKETFYKGPINVAELPEHYNKRKTSRSQDKLTIGVEQFISEYRNAQKFIKSKIGEQGSLLNGALDMIDNLYNVTDPLSVPLPTTQIGASNILSALQAIFNLLKQNRREIENANTSNTDDANTANSILFYTNYIEPANTTITVEVPSSNLVIDTAGYFPNTLTVGNTTSNSIWSRNNLQLGRGASNSATSIEIGTGRIANGFAYIDFTADTVNTDYALRIIRYDTGENAQSVIAHRGSNTLFITAQDAGSVVLQTNSANRVAVYANGVAEFFSNTIGITQANTNDSTLLATTAFVKNQMKFISYSPTVNASTGTITTVANTGSYIRSAEYCLTNITITLTDNGTGAGYINATLPFNVNSAVGHTVSGINSGGEALTGVMLAGTNVVRIFKYNGTYPGATGQNLYVTGTFRTLD